MKQISREGIQRMINVTGGTGGSGGGGGSFDPAAIGLASEAWVEENYISKAFFNRLFTIHSASSVIDPNDPDEEQTIDSIEALVGLWTEQYLSALGQGSGGGGGGGITLNDPLDAINSAGLSDPVTAGSALVWYGGAWTYSPSARLQVAGLNSSAAVSVTGSVTATSFVRQGGTSAMFLKADGSVDTTVYAAQDWVSQNFITIAFFETLFNAVDTNGTKVNANTTTGIDSIKAMFGFWTNQYLSALGQGSGGGGGGVTLNQPLSSINSAGLGAPSVSGSTLVWNGTTWTYSSSIGDTKNTAGSSQQPSGVQLYLIGASAQATWGVTYSNSGCYIGTDGYLYSGGAKVLTGASGVVMGISIGGDTPIEPTNGIVQIPAYPVNTDTLNTAGATAQPNSDIYLVGSGSYNSTYAVTYTNSGCYISSDGHLYSGGLRVLTSGSSVVQTVSVNSGTPISPTNGNVNINCLTSISSSDVTTALGYTPAASSDLANYLPLTGGTLSGALVVESDIRAGRYIYQKIGNNYVRIIDRVTEGPIFGYGLNTSGTSCTYTGYTVYIAGGSQYTNAGITVTSENNVGIGTKTPSYKLDVNGTLGVSGNTTIASGYHLSVGGNIGAQGTITSQDYITATGYKVPSGTSAGFLKADGSVDTTSYSTSDTLNTAGATAQPNSAIYLVGSGSYNSTYAVTYTNSGCYISSDGHLYSGGLRVLTSGSSVVQTVSVNSGTPISPTNGNININCLTSISSSDVTTALGYTPAASSDLANYLPLTGGTLSGALVVESDIMAGRYIYQKIGDNYVRIIDRVTEGPIFGYGLNTSGTSCTYTGYTVYIAGGSQYTNAGITVTSENNVGIGTKTPSYKLDVNGTLGVSGNTTIASGYHLSVGGNIGAQGTITSQDYITATGYKVPSGTSAGFLKADGSVDTTSYSTSDTLNTAGATAQPNSDIYLVGSGSYNSTYAVTYTNSGCYISSDGHLYSGGLRVLTSGSSVVQTISVNSGTPISPTNGNININCLTSISSSDVTTALGYTPAASSDLANYLPLTGGTLSGTLTGEVDVRVGRYIYQKIGDSYIRIIDRTSAGPIFGYGLNTSGYLCIYTGYTVHLNGGGYSNYTNGITVTSANNVGIGTTTPSYKLDINGSMMCSGLNSSGGGSIATDLTVSGHVYVAKIGNGMTNMQFNSNGNVGIGVNNTSGYLLQVNGPCAGTSWTNLSDMRQKNYIEDESIELWQVASAPLFKFTWKNNAFGTDLHIGTSAQYWQTIVPEAVTIDGLGNLGLQYDVVALLAAITTAKKVQEHEQRIEELERENKMIWNMIASLKAA